VGRESGNVSSIWKAINRRHWWLLPVSARSKFHILWWWKQSPQFVLGGFHQNSKINKTGKRGVLRGPPAAPALFSSWRLFAHSKMLGGKEDHLIVMVFLKGEFELK
jgi:hypothetical protein